MPRLAQKVSQILLFRAVVPGVHVRAHVEAPDAHAHEALGAYVCAHAEAPDAHAHEALGAHVLQDLPVQHIPAEQVNI